MEESSIEQAHLRMGVYPLVDKKHQEMEQRLALQDQLLKQQAQQEEQARMITALASDFRSVYYLELDKDRGVCYQSRSDLHGFRAGEQFNYLESVTAYCNQYVLPEYREEFMRFIQPDAIREGLKENLVISYRYTVNTSVTARPARAVPDEQNASEPV